MVELVDVPDSHEISEDQLTISKAKETLAGLKDLNHVEVVKCCKAHNGFEFVVFKTKVQLPQIIKHKIFAEEIIAVGFDPLDSVVPEVFALRKDFPPNLPHTNLRTFEYPKSICLYESPYSEVKLTFTPKLFIERIRNWLRNAAVGALQQKDQFIEPFLGEDDGVIIIPVSKNAKPFLNVIQVGEFKGKPVFLATESDLNSEFILWKLSGKAKVQSPLRSKPNDLNSLILFLKTVGIEFKKELVDLLGKLKGLGLGEAKLIFGAWIEKFDGQKSKNNEHDFYVFALEKSVTEISNEFESRERIDEHTSDMILKQIKVSTYRVHLQYNDIIARAINQVNQESAATIIGAIGLGALGSQIFSNLARQGFGKWFLIDEDVLFPHNLGRHSLNADAVGSLKAVELSKTFNKVLNDSTFSSPYNFNILESKDQSSLLQIIKKSDVIFDFSASVAVARHLAEVAHNKRRIISCFLNPSGTDLIIISEDKKQSFGIDYLEMIYYRELLYNPSLSNHLLHNSENKRYAQSCRDITLKIPQDYFAVHSGIASAALKKIIDDSSCSVSIWQLNPTNFSLIKTEVACSKVNYLKQNNWKIYYDTYLIEKIFEERGRKLPNETGGILIGAYDTFRRKIYIVDSLPSPPDSLEYPMGYQRGITGLDEKLDWIDATTASNLRYIGEWHSHPENCSLSPSNDDKKNFEWIRKVLKNEGLPPLSLIIGDNKKHSLFVESMN